MANTWSHISSQVRCIGNSCTEGRGLCKGIKLNLCSYSGGRAPGGVQSTPAPYSWVVMHPFFESQLAQDSCDVTLLS